MFKRFRISALILAAGTVLTVLPAVSQARDRNDYRGAPVAVSQTRNRNDYRGAPVTVSQMRGRNDYRGRPVAVSQARDRDDYRGPVERHEFVRPERAGFGFGGYSAPRGYWDSNGVWCSYGR